MPGLDGKPGALQVADHTLRLEEPEIEVGDLSSPPIVVPNLGPDVEDDEEEATRPDHSADLIEGGTEFSGREIDEGVERNGRPELAFGCRERQEIAFPELHGRVFPTGDLDHPG